MTKLHRQQLVAVLQSETHQAALDHVACKNKDLRKKNQSNKKQKANKMGEMTSNVDDQPLELLGINELQCELQISNEILTFV